jgi:hypothetical protein
VLSRAVIFRLGTALLGLAALASCNQRRLGSEHDAGGPSVGDGGRVDTPIDRGPPDGPSDNRLDAPADGAPFDVSAADVSVDVTRDEGVDAPPAVCPAAVPPLDVCGCGCCGGAPGRDACYYPSLGQSRDAIPNPMPTPQECATNGCDEGVHYLCCADPGPDSAMPAVCAVDTSIEDMARFTITRRDGDICTTLELGGVAPSLPLVTGPPGRPNVNAWRGPCLPLMTPQPAMGGLGQVTPGTSGTPLPRYDVHVVLFFDHGGGIADAVRIDRDEVAVAPHCATTVCPVCGGTCAFDATYRFTTNGGLAAYRDTTVLAPPASFLYQREPEASPVPEMSCAPALPTCGGDAIDVSDVMAAFTDPDVQDALTRSMGAATLPFYGQDQRGGDGAAFQITRDGGGGFLIGAPCPAGSTPPTCLEIPSGLSRLVSLLIAFNQQQLADPACASLRP